jgi:hypothetical protein
MRANVASWIAVVCGLATVVASGAAFTPMAPAIAPRAEPATHAKPELPPPPRPRAALMPPPCATRWWPESPSARRAFVLDSEVLLAASLAALDSQPYAALRPLGLVQYARYAQCIASADAPGFAPAQSLISSSTSSSTSYSEPSSCLAFSASSSRTVSILAVVPSVCFTIT